MSTDPRERAAGLSCWSGRVEPVPVVGGITNANFRVDDAGQSFFVRIGDDIPVHGVMRFNEAAASQAAHAAGISPEVVHLEPGALVLRFVEGRTLTAEDLRKPETLDRAVDLVRRCGTWRRSPDHLCAAIHHDLQYRHLRFELRHDPRDRSNRLHKWPQLRL